MKEKKLEWTKPILRDLGRKSPEEDSAPNCVMASAPKPKK